MELKSIGVEKIGMGVITEKLNDGFKDLLANVFDPNTDATALRKVIIEVSIKPTKDRTTAEYKVDVRTKTAPVKSFSGILFMGRKGEQYEIFERNPDQANLFTTTDILTKQEVDND